MTTSIRPVSSESAKANPRPLGSSTTSPTPSRTGGASPGGSSQQEPRSTMWKPAPGAGGKRMPQGASLSVSPECGRPVRITVIASLSTSMAGA